MSRLHGVSPVPLVGLAVLTVIAAGLPFVSTGFQNLEWAYVLIFAVSILGLNILTGYSGQISLGHGAFLAVGAFVSAVMQQRLGANPLLTVPVAGLVSAALGYLLGLPALRLEGIYLALATFALAVAMPDLLRKPEALTGGRKGIILAPWTSPTGALTDDQSFYFVCLLIAAVLFTVAWAILRGRTGRAFRAIRDGELAARSFGVNLATYKTLAFSLSAFYAGVGGALYAIATGFVSADAFPFSLSILLLVGAVMGGLGTLEGPVFGALLVTFLPLYSQQILQPISSQVANAAPAVTQGVILLLVLFFARQGISGLVRLGYAKVQARLRGEPAEGGRAHAA
ncbi:MAG: branched-chain amino acid ABC transporter permease [Candidatus Dormibacteraeota bacterium]|nr:branched-chain amino acid ABC transporter permease [Candidatus Dormibacteraeota bacterium]